MIIIPWRGGCPYRERAREFLKARYAGFEVVYGEYEGEVWCKAKAVMPALRNAPSEVVVIADADVWCSLESAIRAVTAGEAEWAMPHWNVHRLTEEASESFMAGGPERATERDPYEGMWGGGIVVAHRDTLLDIPLDPRFEGWGQEDESWGIALDTLAGPAWRGTADLIHLYHPPQKRLTHRRGSATSWKLRQRYGQARGDPDQMLQIIKEAHASDQQALHNRAALGVR